MPKSISQPNAAGDRAVENIINAEASARIAPKWATLYTFAHMAPTTVKLAPEVIPAITM